MVTTLDATPRSSIQKVCAVMGVVFFIIGVMGLMMPGVLGMHLSLAHNIIHLGSGALAFWASYGDDSKKAYTFSLSFGVVYGLLGIIGFVIGQPGYPAVGHMAFDQNLMRVIPNILEFGTNDHAIHVFISGALLVSAISWKRISGVHPNVKTLLPRTLSKGRRRHASVK